MKDLYYEFVNFIQGIDGGVFMTLALLALGWCFMLVVKFFKPFNGTQKTFEKIHLLVLALIIFGILAYLVYLRK